MRLEAEQLKRRAEQARKLLSPCVVCPRTCRVNRLEDEVGLCRIGARIRVVSYGPHFGEEPCLTGVRGSGTIFFSGCNLRCLFCQNHDVSQSAGGVPVSAEGLAAMALDLEARGCHNLNLVSPTHVMPQILEGLAEARRQGLNLPVVWNSGGYESVRSLELLRGVVDIYMPDFKYGDDAQARRLSGVRGYPRYARAALAEMHRQVGDLELDRNGLAIRGLLVRHLVLPDGRASTGDVAYYLARRISPHTWINVMDQYRPAHEAPSFPGMNRRPTRRELREAARAVRCAGLYRGIFPAVS